MELMRRLFILLFFLLCCSSEKSRLPHVNFDHLINLTETVTLGGRACDIIHIYSEYPDYQWVDASSEGIACVDDAARAAVIYLRYYEITKEKKVIERAKRLLNFVLYMRSRPR